MQHRSLCVLKSIIKYRTHPFFSRLANACSSRPPTNPGGVVHGEHANAAPRCLRRCFHVCTPPFCSHPCCRIHKHSVQERSEGVSSLRSVRLFPSYAVIRFVTINWLLLKTDLASGNRISSVNDAWSASHLSLRLNFSLY